MAEFYISLSNDQIADQISTLLNLYNRLYRTHTINSIKKSKSNYFIEIDKNIIIGCTGLIQESLVMSKIHHISVRPEARGKGVAKKLIHSALINCKTEHVYMTIREDNYVSLKLAQTFGFVFITKTWNKDHYIITVGRRRL